MGVLEIIAERRLGVKELDSHPALRAALERVEQSTRRSVVDEDEKARITSIVDLCFAYDREADPDERANILRTLEEVSANEPLELPVETADEWGARLNSTDSAFAKESEKEGNRTKQFLRKYFSLRAKAGLETQGAVAEKAGLSRSYVAVIESGEHFPQQKTLQKLAKAFSADVADLLP